MKLTQTYKPELKNMEVRTVNEIETEINGNIYRKLEIGFDDVNGERIILFDKDMEHIEKYVRGNVGTVRLKITEEAVSKTSKKGNNYAGEKTTILIDDFIV